MMLSRVIPGPDTVHNLSFRIVESNSRALTTFEPFFITGGLFRRMPKYILPSLFTWNQSMGRTRFSYVKTSLILSLMLGSQYAAIGDITVLQGCLRWTLLNFCFHYFAITLGHTTQINDRILATI
jgi:hypothetical protein